MNDPSHSDELCGCMGGQEKLALQVRNAEVWIPAGIVGPSVFHGKFASVPEARGGRCVPLVIFLHGSSGLNDNIASFQKWLAEELGVASIAPDSFAVAGRPVYTSPTSLEIYERVHAIRMYEIAAALSALAPLQWVDRSKLILAGTSEGAVAVARWRGDEFCSRLIYSWSCEKNYFVDDPRNGFSENEYILNVISSDDPYFSPKNEWNKDFNVNGYCKSMLDKQNIRVVLLPGAPHTLFNLPSARWLTASFIKPQAED